MDSMDKKLLFMDLQLFADSGTGEKTEKATPRRREEARKKGQVSRSQDLNGAVILIAGMAVVFVTAPYMMEQIESFTRLYFLERTLETFDDAFVMSVVVESCFLMAKVCLPVMGACFIAALAVSLMQVGFVVSPEALAPDLNRMNPIEGFKNKFSLRAVMELLKSLAKIGITGYIVYTVLKDKFYVLPRFMDMSINAILPTLGDIVLEMAIKVGIVFLIIGIIDFIYQTYEHEKSLKMSKYDIKQEYKQIEGDPQIKSKQRQKQREISMKRMMTEVPKADVVITNPTHYAVALKYEAEKMEAPVMIAKGQDYLALKIREVAEEHKITIVENPPLARMLYASAEIGQAIPEDLYQAVAEVLAFVYKQQKRAM